MSCILKIFLATWMVKVVTCVFIHEPSATLLSSKEEGIDFGFSMGFQKGKNMLVISAPKENNTMYSPHHTIGKVFTCPVSNLNENITCDQANIDVQALAKYDLEANPNQNFLLGASIAITKDYFLTCAPLWTTAIPDPRKNKIPKNRRQKIKTNLNFSYGTCFTYNGTANRYLGYIEQNALAIKILNMTEIKSLKGGLGWNTLVDEENNLILIAKPFTTNAVGYIFYLDAKEPLAGVSNISFHGHELLNLGFGMAAGKFFSKKTSYAVSFQDYYMTGKVLFIEKVEKKDENGTIMAKVKMGESKKDFLINNGEDMGSMFGYTMTATDINGDGFTELIVGAPGQRDENKDYGAVHIYAGGNMKTMQSDKKTIFGVVEGARFGMTIATSDIDGDDIPEIIISAPYEDSGNGAVYIISGHKVNETFFAESTRRYVQVSKLNTQKIQKSDFKLFGYSLQVIEDLDGNGCNELAIGSPGSTAVHLFRSFQAVKVEVNLSTNQQKINDKDKSFYVKVCIDVVINKKSTYVQGKILVNNIAYGKGARLENPSFSVDLAEIYKNKTSQYCEDVTVLLNIGDVGVYRLDTQIEMSGLEESLVVKEFHKTVAVFSSHSKTNHSIDIQRRCDRNDCKPKLSMSHSWSGNQSEYLIGSSENETFSVIVHNDGFNANGGCVHVSVRGAQIKRIRETDCKITGQFYTCHLRNYLRRNTTVVMPVELDMITSMTNLIKSLEFEADLFEDCANLTTLTDHFKLSVGYNLNTTVVHLASENHFKLDITEKSLSEDAPKILNVDQVYLIHNDGKFKWLDLDVEIIFSEADFEFSVKETVGIRNCSNLNEIKVQKLECKVDLDPESITKVILGIEIPKDSIGPYIRNVQETKIESLMSLSLTKTITNIEFRSESIVTYNEDILLAHNKNLWISIGVLVGLLLLGLICFILHRYGFFQGQNKKKLDQARATVRRRSIKKSTTSQDSQRLIEDSSALRYSKIVENDDAFEEPSTATPKRESHKLIEEKAQVHSEDN